VTNMQQLYSTVGGLVVFSLLLIVGLDHARHPEQTRDEIAAQRLWPRWAIPIVQTGLTFIELLVGGLGIASIAVRVPAALERALLLAAAILYLSFATYGGLLLRWRPQAPCGCGTQGQAVSGWTIGRAAVLAAVSGVLLLVDSPLVVSTADLARLSIILLAAAALTVLLLRLPDTMVQAEG
jgi:Methylamine utilisation protein MauE